MQAAAKNLSSKPATTGSRAQHHMSIFDLNGDGKVDAEDFRIAAERAHLAGKEMSTFWYRAPIANLVYGLLDGDRPPSQENLKAVLNGEPVDALSADKKAYLKGGALHVPSKSAKGRARRDLSRARKPKPNTRRSR